MRLTALVIFILCISLASSIVAMFDTSTGGRLFTEIPSNGATDQFIDEINNTVQTQSYLGSSVSQGNVLSQFGDFVTGLYTFVKIFFMSLVLPSQMLQNFGVAAPLANLIAVPIYFIYLVALIQMISGRYVE